MTHVIVDTTSETPVYTQIMDQLRALVREGSLEAGAALPSVRQLAGDLEVNPNTVARAYRLLEREGILRTASRRGTFVANGASRFARRASDRQLDEAIERVIERATHLKLDSRDVLAAVKRRLAADDGDEPSPGDST